MTRLWRHLAATFVILLAGSSAVPTGQNRDAPPAAPRAAVVRGRVIASDTQAPLRDVLVTLADATRITTGLVGTGKVVTAMAALGLAANPITVDDAGRFEFANVPPGQYRIAASPGPTASRYVEGVFPNPDADDPPALKVNAGTVHEVVVTLPRAAVITGRILDDRGSPFANASVTVREALPGGRLERPERPGSALLMSRTDDTGSFRLFGLPAGEYVVEAAAMNSGMLMVVQPQGRTNPLFTGPLYAATFYPGTTSATEAARIRLQPGDVHGPIEFALVRGRKYVLRGTLLDSAGQPAANVDVSLQGIGGAAAGAMRATQSTRSDGTFEITTNTAGEHAISVYRFGSGLREYAWTPVTVIDDVDGLLVMLRTGVTVTGQVLFEGSAPPSNRSLQVRSIPGRAGGINMISVQAEADGSFTLDHQFGPTLVRADGLAGWHLKSVTFGGRDITDVPTEFTPGERLQVVLTSHAAVLTGSVRTARGGTTDASVVLLGDDPATWHERFTTTRLVHALPDGTYRFEGLRAGRYLAVALRRRDATVTNTTPAYFELLARHATPIVIDDGAAKTLDLTVSSLR